MIVEESTKREEVKENLIINNSHSNYQDYLDEDIIFMADVSSHQDDWR